MGIHSVPWPRRHGSRRVHAKLICLVMAALAVAAAVWAVWVSGPSGATPALLVAAVSGAALGVVDARTWRLPDVLVYPTLASVGILLTAAAALTATWGDFGRAGLGALALAVAYLVLHIVDAEPWAR